MDDLIKKHLQDILTAIEEIESFFGDKPKLFDDFYSTIWEKRRTVVIDDYEQVIENLNHYLERIKLM